MWTQKNAGSSQLRGIQKKKECRLIRKLGRIRKSAQKNTGRPKSSKELTIYKGDSEECNMVELIRMQESWKDRRNLGRLEGSFKMDIEAKFVGA